MGLGSSRMRLWAVGVVALGALNLSWHLGSPSLFIDEGLSWGAAFGGIGGVLDGVRATEISPPAHYYGLWAWIGAFGDDEWVLRLPSAVAGVALVIGVLRLGAVAYSREAGVLAAALTALSPLVLTYGQQARSYVFAMLLGTVAVLAALEADRAASARTRHRWLVALGAASILGFWTHYTAALVVLPALAWTVLRQWPDRRAGLVLPGVVLATWIPLAPLLADQLSKGHQQGIAEAARLDASNVVRVVATPFDGRFPDLTAWVALGAVLAAGAVVYGVWRTKRAEVRLLAVAAATPVLGVIAFTLVSDDVLLTRYTAVAAPLMIVLIAGAAVSLPRAAGVGAGVAALACALAGSLLAHRQESFYPDVRGAYRQVAAEYRPGDVVVALGYISIGPVTEYYRRRVLPAGPAALLPADSAEAVRATSARRRLWLITDVVASASHHRRALEGFDYVPRRIRTLEGSTDLQVVLAVPRR